MSFESKIMDQAVAYSVYLPSDYADSDRSYPVVYLLHGYTDDETAWVQFGEVNFAVDRGIASGEIPPMIIVMPDGGLTFYINDYKNEALWEDMFIKEFMPRIESEYRIRRKKEFRGIAGLSMGGYGSAILAMRYPELFAASAPLSAAFYTDEELTAMEADQYEKRYGILYGEGLSGEERLTEHWQTYSVIRQAQTLPVDRLKSVRWRIDCGDDDFLYKGNATMHIILRDRGVPHEYRVRDGAHNWTYWRTGISDALKFIGQSFHR